MPSRFFGLLILLWTVSLPSTAGSHGGGLDAFGCHNDRTHGGYHCHRGPCVGQTFKSQAEMLKLLEKTNCGKENAPEQNEVIPPSSAAKKEAETCVREKYTGKVVCGDTVTR